MRALVYALVGCLAILTLPVVAADDWHDPMEPLKDRNGEYPLGYPHCSVFLYSLEPPYYYLNPGCLWPPP